MTAFNSKRFFRRNGVTCALAAFTLVAAIANFGSVKSYQESIGKTSQIAREIGDRDTLDQLTQQELENKAKIAEARYKLGCQMIVSLKSPDKFISLIEGEPVIDSTTKKPLPKGTTVCDANGNTGVINQNKVVGSLAYTGNTAVVAKARLKVNAKYFTPSAK